MKNKTKKSFEPSTTELPHTPCNGFTLQQPRLLLTRHHPTCLLRSCVVNDHPICLSCCGEVKHVSRVVKHVSRVVKHVSCVVNMSPVWLVNDHCLLGRSCAMASRLHCESCMLAGRKPRLPFSAISCSPIGPKNNFNSAIIKFSAISCSPLKKRIKKYQLLTFKK